MDATRANIKNESVFQNGLPSTQEIDAMIGRAMIKMTVEEREKAMDELHGVGMLEEEDAGFISSCLDQLDEHIAVRKPKTALEMAESMSHEYVHCEKFKLMFLRADRYEPEEASKRMIRFFELKKSLFGTEKLVKDITLEDLDSDDMNCLRTGCVQLSPHKDTAGRLIVLFLHKLRKYKRSENATRAAFYVMMACVESEDAQIRGVSVIHYHVDVKTKSVNRALRDSMPIHLASLHLCVNDKEQFENCRSSIHALTKTVLVRYKAHFGSHKECQHELASYGLPVKELPMNEHGELFTTDHETWVKNRGETERTRLPPTKVTSNDPFFTLGGDMGFNSSDFDAIAPPTLIDILGSSGASKNNSSHSTTSNGTTTKASSIKPGRFGLTPMPDDVLFGRGRGLVDHPGNARFRQIIDLYMEKYEASGRLQKTCTAEVIVRIVKDSGGRFLKKADDGEWDEVNDGIARKKVAHAFRNRRKLQG